MKELYEVIVFLRSGRSVSMRVNKRIDMSDIKVRAETGKAILLHSGNGNGELLLAPGSVDAIRQKRLEITGGESGMLP